MTSSHPLLIEAGGRLVSLVARFKLSSSLPSLTQLLKSGAFDSRNQSGAAWTTVKDTECRLSLPSGKIQIYLGGDGDRKMNNVKDSLLCKIGSITGKKITAEPLSLDRVLIVAQLIRKEPPDFNAIALKAQKQGKIAEFIGYDDNSLNIFNTQRTVQASLRDSPSHIKINLCINRAESFDAIQNNTFLDEVCNLFC